MSEFIQETIVETPENEVPKGGLKLRWIVIPLLIIALLVVFAACAGPTVGNVYGNIVNAL